MEASHLVLAVVALLAGVAGTWSPCGFSVVGSLGPAASGSRGRTLAASLAFVPGALLGGAVTFGGLALLGAGLASLMGLGAASVVVAAAVLAGLAAVADLRGADVVPQVTRQVPESWRRRLPLPLAALAYGVLLGLGFTTFVMGYATWALAAVALVLGDPVLGLVLGVVFGAGRALPVLVLAPLEDTAHGSRALAAMAERPVTLRAVRAAGGGALAAAALALGLAPLPATADDVVARGLDPAADGGVLAWESGEGRVTVRRPGEPDVVVPGADPAVGDGLLAVRRSDRVDVLRLADRERVATVRAPGVSGIAVSERWLVTRAARTDQEGDVLEARRLGEDTPSELSATRAPAQLGRPAIDGDRVVFHVARTSRSTIVEADLTTGARRTLRRGTAGRQVLHPSLRDGALLYVRLGPERQELRLDPVGARERTILRLRGLASTDGDGPRRGRRHGDARARRGASQTFWTTALDTDAAYVSRIPSTGGGLGRLVRVPR